MATRSKAKASQTVEAYLDALHAEKRATVNRLRALVQAATTATTEHIKWNAPSFCVDGDDRVTLGLERDGRVRMVLHRGAKPKDTAGFAFEDPTREATWPAPDRGVVTVKDAADVDARAQALGALVERWLKVA